MSYLPRGKANPQKEITWIDARPPLVAGQPEFREYRVQAVVNNARVGAYSPVSGTWTVP